MSACNLTDHGATVSCRACGLAWAYDARVRPVCPRGYCTAPEIAWGGRRAWVVGLCVGLAVNAALGVVIVVVIVVAMVRGML